jgi:cytoskeletal protein CcmA (bactofilin family)
VAHPGQVTDLRVIDSLIGYLVARCRPRRISIAEGVVFEGKCTMKAPNQVKQIQGAKPAEEGKGKA